MVVLRPPRLRAGRVDRIAHGARRRREIFDGAARRLVDELGGGDSPHFDDIVFRAPLDQGRLAQATPDRVELSMRDRPCEKSRTQRLMPGTPRVAARKSIVDDPRVLGIRTFGQCLADLHDANSFAARDTGDLLHHMHRSAESAGLREAGVSGGSGRAARDDARESDLEFLDMAREVGDRSEGFTHRRIAERARTGREGRRLAIELGELRQTVDAVPKITDEAHIDSVPRASDIARRGQRSLG